MEKDDNKSECWLDEKQILIQAKEEYLKKTRDKIPMPSPERLELLLTNARYKSRKRKGEYIEVELAKHKFDYVCKVARQIYVTCNYVTDIDIIAPKKTVPVGVVALAFNAKQANNLNGDSCDRFVDMALCADSIAMRVVKGGALWVRFLVDDVLVPAVSETESESNK